MNVEFNVKVESGDVYISGVWTSQLAFTPDAVGDAVTRYLLEEEENKCKQCPKAHICKDYPEKMEECER